VVVPNRQVLVDAVYELVKEKIMDMDLLPGSRINMDRLANDLEVSNTPLREALARLEAEGLVIRRSLYGCFVAPLPDEQSFEELFTLRLVLETEAVRGAAQRCQKEMLERLYSTLRETAQVGSSSVCNDRYHGYKILLRSDMLFHDLVAESSGNRLLQHTLTSLHSHLLLYRLYSKSGHGPEGRETAEEHEAIVAALSQHDPAAASDAMRCHLERSRQRVRAAWDIVRSSTPPLNTLRSEVSRGCG
jgi:DNA-binding GntR family transcriptional regulator